MWVKSYFVILIFGFFILAEQWPQFETYLYKQSNGRWECWQQTFKDWQSPSIILPITQDMTDAQKREIEVLNSRTFVYTGRGPGSFPFIYSKKHLIHDDVLHYRVPWDTPHNVYLRVLYELGLFGLVLFVGSIVWIFWRAFKVWPFDRFKTAVFCSAFFISFVMIGIPLEQINPLTYFSVAVFAILSVL